MSRPEVERFVRSLDSETAKSVRAAAAGVTAARVAALSSHFDDPEAAREEAARIKTDVLNRLPQLLDELESACTRNGIRVWRAADAAEANRMVAGICRAAMPDGGVVVKAKSMVTEEIGLNRHLQREGFEPVETDLGEFVVQLDGDTPSHIVAPIIHKNRRQIAETFERVQLGPYTEVPEELAAQAREYLRAKFREAGVGISGVNFAVAETGRLVLVENEGNNRLTTTAPPVHIAVMGIEKLLRSESELPLFLRLLAGSATGQPLTSYTHLISGPRREDEEDGPLEVHLVMLDNGRSRVLEGPYRDILRCIRCGACLNVCPVYRQATGHAYGHVYSGPLGAVLAPALEGLHRAELARASTLCGACEDVCPVKIPIPEMLLRLRQAAHDGAESRWDAFAKFAARPWLWRTGLKLLPMSKPLASSAMKGWAEFREPPERVGRSFREHFRPSEAEPSAQVVPDRAMGASGPSAEDAVSVAPRSEGPPVQASDLREPGPNPDRLDPDHLDPDRLNLGQLDLGQLLGRPTWVDPDALPFLEEYEIQMVSDVWSAEVGVTLADAVTLDTGSLLLSAGPGRRRLASLAPPVHIALVPPGRSFPTLEEAFAEVSPRTSVIVTGTSRTADIEGVLVRGVHGPKELWILPAQP
jgi:L-lactate dehydrogenase complex protein LldF